MRRTFLCVASVLVNFSVVVATIQGAESGRKAATSVADADHDFSLMGEYLGSLDLDISRPDSARERWGLQVVALGAGQFSATSYEGGLPGNGWNRVAREPWQGAREGDQLVLRQADRTIRVQRGQAVVHDVQGRVVGTMPKVLRRSCTLGARPPASGVVLFDGSDASAFKNAKTNQGLLQVGTELVSRYRDYTLHLEFCVPYMPHARGQGRGNSGVYLQSRYEVQILDSFGLEGKNNECGGLYQYVAPDINMAFPPLSWQTYDITFHSPQFDADGNKVQDARLTVLHNGVAVHNCLRVERKTGAGRAESPELLPTKLQDHGNPVQFRNVWLVDLAPYDLPSKEMIPVTVTR